MAVSWREVKFFPAPTANQVWQGQCCAANLRGGGRRNRLGMELLVAGFRFECAPDHGYWLEVQLLEPGGGHLF